MDIAIHASFLPHNDPEPVEQPYGIRDCAFRDPAGKDVMAGLAR